MAHSEAVFWLNPEEAQRHVFSKVCELPRKAANRDFRDLALLSIVTTAGPLAIFALGISAYLPLTACFGAVAVIALGTAERLHRREHPLATEPPSDVTVSNLHWQRASFGLIRGRHKPEAEARPARVTIGAGSTGRSGQWIGR